MKELLKQILTSKKAWATIAAILVWVLGRVGWDVDAEELLPVVGALCAFVVGQALADVGKEAKKLEGPKPDWVNEDGDSA
jgi:hypothetical protein